MLSSKLKHNTISLFFQQHNKWGSIGTKIKKTSDSYYNTCIYEPVKRFFYCAFPTNETHKFKINEGNYYSHTKTRACFSNAIKLFRHNSHLGNTTVQISPYKRVVRVYLYIVLKFIIPGILSYNRVRSRLYSFRIVTSAVKYIAIISRIQFSPTWDLII